MKHYIDAPLGSEEFTRQFQIIRDAFLAELVQQAQAHNVHTFRACEIDGSPFDWVWDDATFKYANAVGDISDAKRFAANMIGQGMHFAFMGNSTTNAVEIWLTTWEAPDASPSWPPGTEPLFEVVHEGVCVGKPPEA